MLGSPILYLKGMRILMFQLSGFYYRTTQQQASIAECPWKASAVDKESQEASGTTPG